MGPIATASVSAALCVPSRNAARATRKKPRIFPAMMPATMTSPPRTRGLPAARISLDSRLSSSQLARPSAGESGAGGFCSGERGIIIRMVGYLFDVFDMPDDVVFVQHENGPALDPQVLDQSAISFSEGTAAMIRQHLDPVDAEGPAPALLRER